MFTGIIEEVGKVAGIKKFVDLIEFKVLSPEISKKVKLGSSIAVNGVCLTVSGKEKSYVNFEVISQTLKKTNLKKLKESDYVNLESSLSVNKTIDGHLVTGHVDDIGKIFKIDKSSERKIKLWIKCSMNLMKFIVPKGSVCIDGVSLTVAEVENNRFLVCLTPYTLKNTIFKEYNLKNEVNIEIDIIARYINGIIEKRKSNKIDKDFLEKYGF